VGGGHGSARDGVLGEYVLVSITGIHHSNRG
jgi:hypothetical protein